MGRLRRGRMAFLSKRLSLGLRKLRFAKSPLAAGGLVLTAALVLTVSTGRAQSGQSQSTNSQSPNQAQSQAAQDIPDAPSTVQPPPAPPSPADRPPIPT